MPALQVRDFPNELYEQLREYAAANHRFHFFLLLFLFHCFFL